jgi:hypothetical protein
MEQTECSETLAFKLHTPVNHPEESIRHSEQDESLKSRSTKFIKSHQSNKRDLRILNSKYREKQYLLIARMRHIEQEDVTVYCTLTY